MLMASRGRTHPGLASSFVARRPLLQRPEIAVWIAEPRVLDAPDVLDLAQLGAAMNERLAGFLDVAYNEMQPLDAARLHLSDWTHTGAEDDGASRAGRRELHDPHLGRHLCVVLIAEADPLVELLGSIDV